MKRTKYPNILFSLLICLTAVGIGSAVNYFSEKKAPEKNGGDFERVSVTWDEPEATGRANAPVTGIPDERITESKITEPEPELPAFALPMGKDIIKDFSDGEMVRSATMGDWRVHNGIDFGGSSGNTVKAAADGVVTASFEDSFWGGIVEIDHGNGVVIRYCGLKPGTCAAEGDEVSAGEKIGSLGSIPIEAADGEHLHIEATVNGKITDPLEVMNIAYQEE